jgi:hypothetical protein
MATIQLPSFEAPGKSLGRPDIHIGARGKPEQEGTKRLGEAHGHSGIGIPEKSCERK